MYLHAPTLMPIKPLSILLLALALLPAPAVPATPQALVAVRSQAGVPAAGTLADEGAGPQYRPPPRAQPGRVFRPHGTSLPPSKEAHACRAGDIVTWRLPRKLIHIGIVSGRQAWSGVPLIIHNIGAGAREENILFSYPITGHYRWQPR